MKTILVFNTGSTSLKFSLFDTALHLKQKGLVEKKGKSFKLMLNGKSYPLKGKSLQEAVTLAEKYLRFSDVKAVGHRVVHGGDFFTEPTLLNASAIKKIEKLSSIAPLHNPMNVEGIKIAQKLFPKVPQVALFDTAFHSQIPQVNKTYPIPLKWYDKGIKRYGFHGINHQYCMERLGELLQKDINKKKLITCHLGGGCSLAAITGGHSIDTTMGFTPLEGLMMATRSGSIDPGILIDFLETKKMTLPQLKHCLNEESGLKGIAKTPDMRTILQRRNPNDLLAVDLFVHSLAKNIAAMAASLEGIDYLVFSGGIGENAAEIRERVCQKLHFLNIAIDPKKNANCKHDQNISVPKSSVSTFCIFANEEWLIAKETLQLVIRKSL